MLSFLIPITALLAAVIIHECCHGWAAYKLGDPTAKDAGRLTINPLAHVDPIGTIIVPIGLALLHSPVVFGWAKPVPINFYNLRNPKRDIIWVSLAGPASNFLAAILISFAVPFVSGIPFLNYLVSSFVLVNLVLAIFNIIPVAPLDGSKVLFGLLPPRYAQFYARLEPYGMILLIALLYLGLAAKIVWPLVSFFSRILGVNPIL